MSNEQAQAIIALLNSFKESNEDQHNQIIKESEKQSGQIIYRLDKTNGNVKANTEFRLTNTDLIENMKDLVVDWNKTKGGFATIKWLVGFIGAGNIIILIKLFS